MFRPYERDLNMGDGGKWKWYNANIRQTSSYNRQQSYDYARNTSGYGPNYSGTMF